VPIKSDEKSDYKDADFSIHSGGYLPDRHGSLGYSVYTVGPDGMRGSVDTEDIFQYQDVTRDGK
jgi:hypothetical protein